MRGKVDLERDGGGVVIAVVVWSGWWRPLSVNCGIHVETKFPLVLVTTATTEDGVVVVFDVVVFRERVENYRVVGEEATTNWI